MSKSALTGIAFALLLAGCGSAEDPIKNEGSSRRAAPPEVLADQNMRIVRNSSAERIACPVQNFETWFVAGQSNAAGSAESPETVPVGSVVQFHSGECYALAQPFFGASSMPTDGSYNAFNPFGYVAAQYSQRTGKTVVLKFMSIGGQSIRRWAVSGDLYTALSAELQQFGAYAKVDRFLWQQGETDALNGMSANEYTSLLNEVLNNVYSQGFSGTIHVARSSRCYDLDDNPVGTAQDAFRAQGFYGPNTDLISVEMRHDKCHFSAQGIVEFSRLWNQVLGG